MSKLWIVTWVKEGVFRSSQSSKVQLIIESRTKTSEKPKNGLFTSSPSLEMFEYPDRGHLVSMVDEGLRIRVTVVIFATGKTEQFAVCGHVIPT